MKDSRFVRRLKVDETFFEKIDTEEKAYWLGFLVGDGHVSHHPGLVLGLKESDKDHVEKFRMALKAEAIVRVYSRKRLNGQSARGAFKGSTPYARLNITSRKLCTPLLKMGFGKGKTRNIKAFRFVPAKLKRHFWRGLMDADGSIVSKEHSGVNQQWGISIVGNRHNCHAFSRWLKKKGIKTSSHVRKTERLHCYKWSVNGNEMAKAIITLLWKDATVFMDRKNELAKRCMADETYAQRKLGREHLFLNENKYKQMIKAYKNGNSQAGASARFGVDRKTLSRALKIRGIKRRTLSEAQVLAWKKKKFEKRKRKKVVGEEE